MGIVWELGVCVWEEWGLCGNRNMVEGEAKNMGEGVFVLCAYMCGAIFWE